MTSVGEGKQPEKGRRERKKAKTRAAIQRHALRLFQKQGYEATTVEQIADAVDISSTTFFRYFPTKEDVVLYDVQDPVLFAAFEAQPADLSPIQAMRRAVREVFTSLPAGVMEQEHERSRLILTVPELRMRLLDQLSANIQLAADLVAKRLGRRSDEFTIRTYAGAMIGVVLSAMFTAATDPETDMLELLDASLEYLEAGLPV